MCDFSHSFFIVANYAFRNHWAQIHDPAYWSDMLDCRTNMLEKIFLLWDARENRS